VVFIRIKKQSLNAYLPKYSSPLHFSPRFYKNLLIYEVAYIAKNFSYQSIVRISRTEHSKEPLAELEL
jgi:hypothetical protein